MPICYNLYKITQLQTNAQSCFEVKALDYYNEFTTY